MLHIDFKIKFYLYSNFSLIYYFYQSTSTKIEPELKKNILNFGYGINYKYEGMLVHSFDRFYVVTKFSLALCGFLILFVILYMTQGSNFLSNRTKFL